MFNFFKKNDNSNAHNSIIFLPLSDSSNVFCGSIGDFINKKAELNEIQGVRVLGDELSEDTYDSSLKMKLEPLKQFMNLVDETEIKALDFTGSTLNPEAGVVIGDALKTNKTLESLAVTSNELGQKGIIGILNGLTYNRSIKTFYASSYNVQNF